MSVLERIKQTITQNREELLKKYKVKSIFIFGSYARGDQNKKSDIDILVEFSEPVGFFNFLDLEEYLAGLLGRKVDMVTKKALKPNIGKNILREMIRI